MEGSEKTSLGKKSGNNTVTEMRFVLYKCNLRQEAYYYYLMDFELKNSAYHRTFATNEMIACLTTDVVRKNT